MTDLIFGIEQSLIGSVLAFPNTADDVMDVRPQDMSCVSHQNMWTEVIGMNRSRSLSVRGIIEIMKARETLEPLGYEVGEATGELYVQETIVHRSEASVRQFADMIIDASTKRELRSFGQLLALDAESTEEATVIIESAEERLYDLRRRKLGTGVDIGDILGAYEVVMDKWRAGEAKPAFRFSSQDLRKIMPFLEEQDFMVVAGRPGEGKSSWMRYEAFMAAQAGQKVVIFNLENGEVEYARYLIAFITNINTEKLRSPELLTEAEVLQVKAAIKLLRSLPLRIVTMGAPSVREITAIAAKLAREGYKVFFVDYIQLVRNGNDNIVQDIGITTSLLRGFALKYKTPVIAASQLNRLLVHRGVDAEPNLADLRDSGSLEQDAVQVMFTRVIQTDDAGLKEFPENLGANGQLISQIRCVPMRMYVLKNRNGSLGKTEPIKWDKAVNKFYPLAIQR